MGSQWTNKYLILRDLSFAQGRKVPAEIIGSVGVGQKPPAVKIKEDTEEEFYQNFVGNGDVHAKPDLTLIKEMIEMVQQVDPDDSDVDDTEKQVEISKLNPLSKEFVPNVKSMEINRAAKIVPDEQGDTAIAIANEANVSIEQKAKQRKRYERNFVLMSFLEKEKALLSETSPRDENISTDTIQVSEKQPDTFKQTLEVKPLKPNEVLTDTTITDAVEKVNKWLRSPTDFQIERNEQKKSINLSPIHMFKKKKQTSPISLEGSMFKKKDMDSDNAVPRQSENVFVPSSHANEYYKKFIERHQVQEMAQEDIWKRAERLMKEIDAKRLKEKEQKLIETQKNTVELNTLEDDCTTNNGLSPLPINIPGLDIPSVRASILLTQHRHELPEECKVCLALAKYKHLTS